MLLDGYRLVQGQHGRPVHGQAGVAGRCARRRLHGRPGRHPRSASGFAAVQHERERYAVSDKRMVTSGGCGVQVIHPPGGYGDDPVYVRVNRELAGAAWPVRGWDYSVEINHPRCRDDPAHIYLRAHNPEPAQRALHGARWSGRECAARCRTGS